MIRGLFRFLLNVLRMFVRALDLVVSAAIAAPLFLVRERSALPQS